MGKLRESLAQEANEQARRHELDQLAELLTDENPQTLQAFVAGPRPIPNLIDETPDEELSRLVWDYFNAPAGPHLHATTTWAGVVPEILLRLATGPIDHLWRLAERGNAGASASIAKFVVEMAQRMGTFSKTHPDLVRPVARKYPHWPVLKAKQRIMSDDHKLVVRTLEVGRDLPFSKEAARRVTGASSRAAVEVLCRLESFRVHKASYFLQSSTRPWVVRAAKLRPFSAQTWKDWLAVAWDSTMEAHAGHPEKDPVLRRLGEYRKDHSKHIGQQETVRPRTRESNIRDGIRTALANVFKRLAAKA